MKLLKVRCKDAQVGNISIGLADNGKKKGNFIWDEKAGNITVDGKMYTFYLDRARRASKDWGLNGGHILELKMTNHYKDPNKDYFWFGYKKDPFYEDKSIFVDKNTKPTWYIKPTTPEAKAAFEALVKKYN